jgi:DNA-binding NtrC family response regulator
MTSAGPTKKILIVDDDQQVCRLLTNILHSQDRTVLSAGSVTEAREILDANSVNLLLLDLYLPDGNGLDLLSQLKKSSGAPVIIMMTAFGDWEAHVKSYNMGAFYFLDKPFQLTQVRTLVEHGLKLNPVAR